MALDFTKIKSLFVYTQEEQQMVKNEQKISSEETRKKTTGIDSKKEVIRQPRAKKNVSTGSTNGAFNQKIHESLMKALSEANLPGEDYLEFAEAFMAMKDIPLEEKVKMQTVMVTLSTKGLTLQKIIESADYYVKVLENEKNKFSQVLNSQTDGKINNKYKDIKVLEKSINEKSETIKLLTEEITKSQEEILRMKNMIKEAEDKIKTTANDFNITFNFVVNKIKSDVEKIKTLK